MDRALDETVRERSGRSRTNSRRGPRGGVRKPGRSNGSSYDESRLWVHDKFDGDSPNDGFRKSNAMGEGRRGLGDSRIPPNGAKVKVENIHYDLGEEDLLSLFRQKGPVLKLDLLYDRAGRSEGTAFVLFENEDDAHQAIRDFDGANAHGQPISLTIVARGNGRLSTSEPAPSRSLFDRIASPERTERRDRDSRRDPTRKATPPGIDRYVPPERRRQRDSGERERERRPGPSRGDRGDRERGGGRRGQGRAGNAAGNAGGSNRPKKTVEELDAEMNDYFGGAQEEAAAPAVPVQQPANEDEDMVL
ncbi:hypothetical protein EDC01DRAFT_96208 [Geopyxis carbonaria]|nr:hypothetical protein EDC01DRAFT_96208 [Geopyxis carbonaria]